VRHARRSQGSFPLVARCRCECGCGWEGLDDVTQFCVEEACYELVAMQEHNRTVSSEPLEETPAERHDRMMRELRSQ
jgi:hypothetical protein